MEDHPNRPPFQLKCSLCGHLRLQQATFELCPHCDCPCNERGCKTCNKLKHHT